MSTSVSSLSNDEKVALLEELGVPLEVETGLCIVRYNISAPQRSSANLLLLKMHGNIILLLTICMTITTLVSADKVRISKQSMKTSRIGSDVGISTLNACQVQIL